MVFSIVALDKIKIDDPVGAISVHGVVGIWGLIAVTLSNREAVLITQLVGLITIMWWVFMASLIVRVVLKVTIGIRVTEEEYDGLDLTDCDLEAYPEFTGLRGAGKYSYSI